MNDFTCRCRPMRGCEHSILVTDTGLRLVSRKEWYRANGIPSPDNLGAVVKFLKDGNGRVKYKDGTQLEFKGAA